MGGTLTGNFQIAANSCLSGYVKIIIIFLSLNFALRLNGEWMVVLCTAIGNLGQYLNQDCDTMPIQLKGDFRWQKDEDSLPNLRRKWL